MSILHLQFVFDSPPLRWVSLPLPISKNKLMPHMILSDQSLNTKFVVDRIQFWKFAMTGADNNKEIKIWSCESWTCLQTLRFLSPPNLQVEPCIKAAMDLSANYLVLSDINRKVNAFNITSRNIYTVFKGLKYLFFFFKKNV